MAVLSLPQDPSSRSVRGLGLFGGQGSGSRVQGLGLQSSGFRAYGSGFRVQGVGLQGSGLTVQGSGFRVQDSFPSPGPLVSICLRARPVESWQDFNIFKHFPSPPPNAFVSNLNQLVRALRATRDTLFGVLLLRALHTQAPSTSPDQADRQSSSGPWEPPTT